MPQRPSSALFPLFDNDCNGQVDEGCCEDKDGDGYYGLGEGCPEGNDCDDGNPAIKPGAEEVCDGVDRNCNGILKEGGYSIPNVPLQVRQCDSRWATLQYDNINKTICKKGCALSSLVMLMNSKGCYVDLLTVNACGVCFNDGGDIAWAKVLKNYCPSVKYPDKADASRFVSFQNLLDPRTLRQDLKNGYRYILHVKLPDKEGCTHFVLLKGISDDCGKLKVIDPASKLTEVEEICGYRKFK